MINQNTSVFFMHNFALKSSLAAKIEIVKALRAEMRDYFGKINEFKSKYNPSHIRRLVRNLYRLQKNKNCSGAELAEKLWPSVENYLSSDIDLSNSEKSEFEKKAYLIIILERANKFFNFDFLPKDTEFQIYIFYALTLDYLSKLIKTLFHEELSGHIAINSFMLNKLSYALNLSVFLHMNPDENKGYLQDLNSEIKLFIPVKKLKVPSNIIKATSILFENSLEETQNKLNNSLFRTSNFSFLATSSNLGGTSVINSLFYSFIEKKINFKKTSSFNDLVLSFESALLLADKLNIELEDYNNEISELKYNLKDLILNARSPKLYQIYFNDEDLFSNVLRETVREMAEEAGVSLNGLEKELIKSRTKSKDFYRSVNSYLVCSCSYFDTKLIKQKFFNKAADFLSKALPEVDLMSPLERESIALASLSSLEGGVDLLISIFSEHGTLTQLANNFDLKELLIVSQKETSKQPSSMDFYSHNIQFALWQKAKQIIKRIKIKKTELEKIQHSITELQLV